MSIPAQRIKQLRAIFAKARFQIKKSNMGLDAPKAGYGLLSAWAAGSKNTARRIRDVRNDHVVFPAQPMSTYRSRKIPYGHSPFNIDLPYVNNANDIKRLKLEDWMSNLQRRRVMRTVARMTSRERKRRRR